MAQNLKKYVFAISGEIIVEAKDGEEAQSKAYDMLGESASELDIDFQGEADEEED